MPGWWQPWYFSQAITIGAGTLNLTVALENYPSFWAALNFVALGAMLAQAFANPVVHGLFDSNKKQRDLMGKMQAMNEELLGIKAAEIAKELAATIGENARMVRPQPPTRH